MAGTRLQDNDILGNRYILCKKFPERAPDRFVRTARGISADDGVDTATLGKTELLNITGQSRLRNVDLSCVQALQQFLLAGNFLAPNQIDYGLLTNLLHDFALEIVADYSKKGFDPCQAAPHTYSTL